MLFHFDTLPVELAKMTFECINNISADASLLLAGAFGSLVESLSFRLDRSPTRPFFIPWCAAASAGLKSIDLEQMKVNDGVLNALSHSPVASGLTALRLNAFLRADRSAALWSKFHGLKTLIFTEASAVSVGHLTALSQLRTLESLTVCPTCEWIEAARILLGPTALPSIQSLRIVRECDSAASVEELHEVLLARPALIRDQLVRLPLNQIHLEYHAISECASRIWQLCPELDLSPEEITDSAAFVNQLATVPAKLLRGTKFFAVEDRSGEEAYDLETDTTAFRTVIAHANQSLESLRIDSMKIRDESWFALQQLHALTRLNCLHPTGTGVSHFFSIAPRVLPSSLTSLSLRFWPEMEDTTEEIYRSLNIFIPFLCSNLRNLTSLHLDMKTAGINPDHFTLIMNNLLHLTSLRVVITSTTGAQVELPLSHPSLTEWPDIEDLDEILRIRPVALPSLQKLTASPLTTPNYLSLRDLTPTIAPQIECIELDLAANISPQIDTMLATVVRFEHSLHRLSLDLPTDYSNLSMLTRLSQLRSLALNNAIMSDALCSSILASCPLLTTLSLVACSGVNSLSWLKHSALAGVHISRFSPGSDHLAAIHIGPADLPNLDTLHISLNKAKSGSVWISGLRNLFWFHYTAMGSKNVPVYISDCPALESIAFVGVGVGAIAVAKCPRLEYMSFAGCRHLDRVMDEGKLYIHENNAYFRCTIGGEDAPEEWDDQISPENLKRIKGMFAATVRTEVV